MEEQIGKPYFADLTLKFTFREGFRIYTQGRCILIEMRK